MMKGLWIPLVLAIILLASTTVLATPESPFVELEDRIAALEARVTALEARTVNVQAQREPQEPERTTVGLEAELHDIQTAIAAMLNDSATGTLEPMMEPTADLTTVQTTDGLVLTDYMPFERTDGPFNPGCSYTFTADGHVTQIQK